MSLAIRSATIALLAVLAASVAGSWVGSTCSVMVCLTTNTDPAAVANALSPRPNSSRPIPAGWCSRSNYARAVV